MAERRAAAVPSAGRRGRRRGWRPCRSASSRPGRRAGRMLAGEYFTSIAALAGAAYKMEMNLARFYQRSPQAEPGWQPPAAGCRHRAPGRCPAATRSARSTGGTRHSPLADTAATAADDGSRFAWSGSGRLPRQRRGSPGLVASPALRAFRQLLADSQHLVPIREEQTAGLTLPWPVMRRAVKRIGQALAGMALLADPDDVFFLTRDEVLAALDIRRGLTPPDQVAARRATREEQAKLVPPLLIGRMNPMLKRMWDKLSAHARRGAIGRLRWSPAARPRRDARRGRSASSAGRMSSTRFSRARSWWRRSPRPPGRRSSRGPPRS